MNESRTSSGGDRTLVRVALPLPLEGEFDYLAGGQEAVAVGAWVEVKLGPRSHIGVVVALPADSGVAAGRLKSITRVVGEYAILTPQQIALGRFISDYYQAPLGMTLAMLQPPPRAVLRDAITRSIRMTRGGLSLTVSPRAVLQKALQAKLADGLPHVVAELGTLGKGVVPLLRRWQAAGYVEPVAHDPPATPAIRADFVLNDDQSHAAAEIARAMDQFSPFLLYGVTGSGKTAVYLHVAAKAIATGGQVLMLVPEINLTPQLALHVRAHLPGVRLAMLHSGLRASEKYHQWHSAAAGEAQLVIGTRLAVFTPLPRLRLIIVDEEHDSSFKQQEGLRYHARDVALYRAQQEGVAIVLGSATPALETYSLASRGRYRFLRLPHRVATASLPGVHHVPQRQADKQDGLTATLLKAIETRLERGEQSMLFINRRGYAPSLLCRACGWAAPCPRCAARLVVHLQARRLACHHCAHERALPECCPQCGNQDLMPMGFGTQRLESSLQRRFPGARILRIDRDSTRRRDAWPQMLGQIQRGEADILVGTQMLAKGHDFPRLTLVGVLGADNALYSADFRATEKVFAQLLQVAGRAGRGELAGEVIVQTDFPQHPVYQALREHDYASLAAALLAERKQALLPPYSYLALLRAEAHSRKPVDAFLAGAHDLARASLARTGGDVRVYPPVAASMARRAGYERAHLLLQATARRPLLELMRGLRPMIHGLPGASRVRWSFDVDPIQVE